MVPLRLADWSVAWIGQLPLDDQPSGFGAWGQCWLRWRGAPENLSLWGWFPDSSISPREISPIHTSSRLIEPTRPTCPDAIPRLRRMDLLEDFLAQPRARDAFLLHVVMGRPWSLSVEDKAPLSIVAVLSGGAWLTANGSRSRWFEAGEVLVVRSPTTYTLSSDQDNGGVFTRIGAGQVCSGPDGRDLSEELNAGVRTWGNDPQGEDQLLVGTYRHHSELGRLMLQSLPPWFLVSSPIPELVSLLTRETAHDGFAQSSVLDRLLDVLLVTTLRAWIDTGAQDHASLLSAPRDDVVRRATEAVHADPSHDWAVESLAAVAGVSRASLTRRFNATLGVSPMTYVTQWRLGLAADLLIRSDANLSAIAHQVGYASPFSFSSAFKNRYGLSPRDFRAASHAP